tara:strand:- start:9575 stop:9862 length:288 start_codon:yes stop_codon:yes gene_type:complete
MLWVAYLKVSSAVKMSSLKNILLLIAIAICIFTTNSYTFNKMITSKNTFTCNKKCNNCVFKKFKTLPNDKNFTDVREIETDQDFFIQEGEINIID